jgi:hypothetical protein
MEERLRRLGFINDDRVSAPMCRWIFRNQLTVDIMPTTGDFLGLSTALFPEPLESARTHKHDEIEMKVISPPCFLATKYAAFLDRGKSDYLASHDLEDFITVVDARAAIVKEVGESQPKVRDYVKFAARRLLESPSFLDALPGHLPPDTASQQRLPIILKRLRELAD